LPCLRAVQEAALTQLSDGLPGHRTREPPVAGHRRSQGTLPQPLSLNTEAMQEILQSALSLDDFAAFLREQPSSAPDDLPDFAAAQGTLRPPVTRHRPPAVRTRPTPPGVARPGLVLATRPNALVTTPWPASVRYAGPLLDYGNVIILEPEATIF
jgi:hypothetical protein